MNLNSKNGRNRRFSYETKESISFIPTRRMCLCFLIMKTWRLLCEFKFIPIDKGTLILKKGGKWSFSYETKVTIHLSQWVEWIYGTQSSKEKKLLYEFMFIPIERQNLILKIEQTEVFLMKPKSQFIYPN